MSPALRRPLFRRVCVFAIPALCGMVPCIARTRSQLLCALMEAGIVALIIGAIIAFTSKVEQTRLLGEAAEAYRKGDADAALRIAQSLLGRRLRWDLEMRALYIIGLVAERNADFAEAQTCFHLLLRRLPGRAKRCALYARCHLTYAFGALGRLEEAEREVTRAWDLATTPPYFANDEKVAPAVLDLEQGRDPVALIEATRVAIAEARARACLQQAGPFRSAAVS